MGKLKVDCSSQSPEVSETVKIKPNAISKLLGELQKEKEKSAGRARIQRWTQRTKLAPLQTKNLPRLIAGNINVMNPLHSGMVCAAWLHKNVTLVQVICCYKKAGKKHAYVEVATEVDSLSYVSVEQFKPTFADPDCTVFVSNVPKFAHFLSKYVMYGLEVKHYEVAGSPHKILTLTDLGRDILKSLNNIGDKFSSLW